MEVLKVFLRLVQCCPTVYLTVSACVVACWYCSMHCKAPVIITYTLADDISTDADEFSL